MGSFKKGKKMRKKAITLLEIMIVITLIALIGGVLSYNMKGSLDKGRAFKTEQAQKQIADILEMERNERCLSYEEAAQKAEELLGFSGLIKEPQEFLKDGWGQTMQINLSKDQQGFEIFSENLEKYNLQHGKKPEAK